MAHAILLLVLVIALPLALSLSPPSHTGAVAPRPHILFILADDYGWNDIGYHQSEIPTPHLDGLAAQGIKLENYYVQLVCTPSRAAVMTGRYPIRYGLQHDVIHPPMAAGLFLNETTLASKMREAGYATHAIGKWHLGFFKWDYTPTHRGFDTHFGYLGGAEDYFNHNASWVYNGFDFRNNTQVYSSANGIYSSSLFEKEAERILNEYTNAPVNDRKPMFIYLAMQTCHLPLEVPPEYEAKCSFIKNKDRKTFCGMTVNMDLTIQNITKAFEKAGILNNTLIVFSSDNGGFPVGAEGKGGGASNWPLRGGKFTLWEGGVRGVSFMVGAGIPKDKIGSEHNGLMHITDWFPTLLGVAGGNTQGTFPLDGVDQWQAITQGKTSPRTEILHNIDELANNSALRSGDWKIVVGHQTYSGWYPPPTLAHPLGGTLGFMKDNNTVSLFNITADPTEKHDLASAHPVIVKHLLDRIELYRKGLVPAWSPPDDPASNPAHFGGVWAPWR